MLKNKRQTTWHDLLADVVLAGPDVEVVPRTAAVDDDDVFNCGAVSGAVVVLVKAEVIADSNVQTQTPNFSMHNQGV